MRGDLVNYRNYFTTTELQLLYYRLIEWGTGLCVGIFFLLTTVTTLLLLNFFTTTLLQAHRVGHWSMRGDHECDLLWHCMQVSFDTIVGLF